MNFIRYIERFQRVDHLIRQKATGSPDELANRLHLSKRQLFRIIETLKDYGAPIDYSRSLKTFYYLDKNFEIKINFSIQLINEDETVNIYGGYVLEKWFQCYFLAMCPSNLTVQFSANNCWRNQHPLKS